MDINTLNKIKELSREEFELKEKQKRFQAKKDEAILDICKTHSVDFLRQTLMHMLKSSDDNNKTLSDLHDEVNNYGRAEVIEKIFDFVNILVNDDICPICFGDSGDNKIIKTKCCKQLICKKCNKDITDKCPFCRKVKDDSESESDSDTDTDYNVKPDTYKGNTLNIVNEKPPSIYANSFIGVASLKKDDILLREYGGTPEFYKIAEIKDTKIITYQLEPIFYKRAGLVRHYKYDKNNIYETRKVIQKRYISKYKFIKRTLPMIIESRIG